MNWGAGAREGASSFDSAEAATTMPGEWLARRLGARGALLFLIGAGCVRSAVAPEPTQPVDPCLIAPAPAVAPESLSIALTERSSQGLSVSSPVGGPRAVQKLMYENLIAVDCTGAFVAELAERWEIDSTGRRWIFTIRDDARWPSGQPVTARDVTAAWRSLHGHQSAFARVLDSTQAIDDHRIRVALDDGDARVLAAQELTILLRASDTDRFQGTGAYGEGGVPRQAQKPSGESVRLPRLQLVTLDPLLDGRDVLDRGVDLMLTDDPSVARYAMERKGLAVYPLPPQRSYAVVSSKQLAPDDSLNVALSTLRASLAEDVVEVPARPVSTPWWLSEVASCELTAGVASAAAQAALRHVAYREDDPVARAIAERLVSLSSRDDDSVAKRLMGAVGDAASGPVAAEAMHPDDFAQALRDRTRAAFVVSLPARPVARCSAVADVARAIPWAVLDSTVDRGFVTPLVDAGAWAIVRRGAVGIAADWDGTPRLVFSSSPSQDGVR
jgi:hypothetical protein